MRVAVVYYVKLYGFPSNDGKCILKRGLSILIPWLRFLASCEPKVSQVLATAQVRVPGPNQGQSALPLRAAHSEEQEVILYQGELGKMGKLDEKILRVAS